MIKRKRQPVEEPREPKKVRVILIGNAKVGKTAIAQRLTEMQYTKKHEPTIGADSFMWSYQNTNLTVWDMSGDKQFLEVRNEFYKEASVIVLVFDTAMRTSFDELDMWLREANGNGAHRCNLLLVANKMDLAGRRSVTKEEAQQWARTRSFQYFEASAQDETGIADLRRVILSN